ncbi:DUF3592 domain-containing protein [Nakamurella multipartita]|uniref:DUF3592 domain-containing protein n=1 Tax=Nakamurella multipartita (strain ATCC 700099 / DSM 44233 / CIP 104796 / JCM 9543 / NBRC 105858 / Y-104) TaxID=479431 RepID=C8X7D2_NAKMY|nr:DUF3592 domain-containing protein [Nakamurella multipartita]ACV77001.1 hypothetical protein Namu_0586 [Nakamurella multipartita DSM 44233]
MPDWLSLVLAMVPIVLAAAFGTRQVIYSKRAREWPAVPSGWVRAQGVVVDEQALGRRRPAKDGTAQRIRRPVITFRAADGREITFTSRIRAAGTPGVGSLVEVYHDPFDPTMASIAPQSLPNVVPALGLAEKWVVVNIWIMVVVIGVIIGLVVLHRS